MQIDNTIAINVRVSNSVKMGSRRVNNSLVVDDLKISNSVIIEFNENGFDEGFDQEIV